MSQRPVELIPTLRLPKTFRMSPDCTALRVEQLKHAPQNYCSAFTRAGCRQVGGDDRRRPRRMLTLAGALLPDLTLYSWTSPPMQLIRSQRACWELLSERARAGKTIVLATQFAWEADQCTRLASCRAGPSAASARPRRCVTAWQR